ncbi:MAG: hypothetical protein QNJ94_18745 [Alphaproteobacteria bacterium]|nr:hypothetical protein [Alphaproteobacteria bacterium]
MSDQPRRLAHSVHDATDDTTEAVAANPNRTYLLVQNDSDTVVYISMAVGAVVNQGIRLVANGGSYEASPRNGNVDTRPVNCVHGGSGNKRLLITEG